MRISLHFQVSREATPLSPDQHAVTVMEPDLHSHLVPGAVFCNENGWLCGW